jgi:glycosyltransferase involved in cell wall biosynthesis
MFKIISVGWNCEEFIDRTLASVAAQTCTDWQLCLVYDLSPDAGAKKLREWCVDRWDHSQGPNPLLFLNTTQQFAIRNQYEGIRWMKPADEDIVVFLDLDGDQLAHPDVLTHLLDYYSDGTLLTYGSYEPIPFADTCPAVLPFPEDVVANNSYRDFIRCGGPCSFNHLRTMKGKVATSIPIDQFKWHGGDWYNSATDYTWIIQGLERAGGRYKVIPEVLLLYNNANPHADYLEHPIDTNTCCLDFLAREPLDRLP